MKAIIFLLVCCLPNVVFCQTTLDERSNSVARMYPGGDVQAYDLRSRKEIKRAYLFDDYREGHFVFSSDYTSQRSFPIKYDILNQDLIVNAMGGEFVVPMDSIVGFFIEDELARLEGMEGRTFLIRRKGDAQNSMKIYEVLEKGKFRLYVEHFGEKLKPNYNPALDLGRLDEKVVKKEKYFLLDQKGRLREIPTKKKAGKAFFQEYSAAENYLAQNKVDFKNRKSLTDLVLFMNN